MSNERGKWEQLARDLAACMREQEQLREQLTAATGRRTMLERKLWEQLEQEQAPLGPEVWQAEQDAKRLDPWALGRPAPALIERVRVSPNLVCGLNGCTIEIPHSHGVDR